MAPRIDYDSDPNFVIVEDVPILDEHSLFIPGNPEKKTEDRTVHVNAEMLAEIAANNNRNVAETGDMVPLIEGHTRDDVPESEQPEILGWADSFRVGPLFNTGRACILSRWKVPKDPTKLEKVRKLPRRSVELWLDRKEINPIALLGATAPERNLGLLRLARMSMRAREENGKLLFSAARELIRFQYDPQTMQAQMPCPGMPATQPADPRTAAYTPTQGTQTPQVDPALIQAVVAALQQTDVWQFMQQQLQQLHPVGISIPFPPRGSGACMGIRRQRLTIEQLVQLVRVGGFRVQANQQHPSLRFKQALAPRLGDTAFLKNTAQLLATVIRPVQIQSPTSGVLQGQHHFGGGVAGGMVGGVAHIQGI